MSGPRFDGRRRKVVVGITGASGAPYAKRLLQHLAAIRDGGVPLDVGVCLSSTAPEVWALECGGEIRESVGFPLYGLRDYRAPFASGSAGWDSMAIVPCSMGTVARIAHGISDTLLTRAADVMLKERRTLIVVPRETPLGVIHLENLTALARAGATVMPAMPSFYAKPETTDALLDTVLARVLDHLGFEHDLMKRWGDRAAEAGGTPGQSARGVGTRDGGAR
jgi:4-hydroxy-3-polyprenylbenzoate decarboxylase